MIRFFRILPQEWCEQRANQLCFLQFKFFDARILKKDKEKQKRKIPLSSSMIGGILLYQIYLISIFFFKY